MKTILTILTCLIFFFISAVHSADSSSSSVSVSPTLVWVTGTDSNGVTQTTQSEYTQFFSTFFTSVASPSSGDIALGSISGTVGGIRTYSFAKEDAGAVSLRAFGDSPGKGCMTVFVALICVLFVLLM